MALPSSTNSPTVPTIAARDPIRGVDDCGSRSSLWCRRLRIEIQLAVATIAGRYPIRSFLTRHALTDRAYSLCRIANPSFPGARPASRIPLSALDLFRGRRRVRRILRFSLQNDHRDQPLYLGLIFGIPWLRCDCLGPEAIPLMALSHPGDRGKL